MHIRLATINDLDTMMDIFAYAREQMRLSGNPNQWGKTTPAREDMISYIEKNQTFLLIEDGLIKGTFVFFVGIDPTYNVIYDGNWLNDKPYGVIHKIAKGPNCSGILEQIISYCEKQIDNIRIDTHDDNKIMQHLLEKYGFIKCGRIHLENGSPRIAYHKEI